MDETYVRVKGEWTYLYRAVDHEGQTIDFLLTPHRDKATAEAFFPLTETGRPFSNPMVTSVDLLGAC